MCQIASKNNITVMCNKVENELYRLWPEEKRREKKRDPYWMVKETV
jgi:hypothetical protein